MTLGEAIKYGRDNKNLSRRRLADMLHIEEKVLKKYEDGTVMNPDKKLVNEIFNALDMDPPYNDAGELTDSFGIFEDTDENGTGVNSPKITRYGTCQYCGQQALVTCKEYDDQDFVDAEATWKCKCETASAVRRKAEAAEQERLDRERRIDAAVFDINNLIADAGYPEVAAILCKAVPELINGRMKKISVSIDSKNSATVSITSQGKVQVERRQVNIDQAESE